MAKCETKTYRGRHPDALKRTCLARQAGVLLLCGLSPSLALSVSCPVAAPHAPSPAEMAFLRSDYDGAVRLYNEALANKPNDPGLTAGLAEVLLHQQKVAEANELVTGALSTNPKSAVLKTALGFVQFRAGTPWAAAGTAAEATKLDPCYARSRLLNVEILRLSSLYKSAYAELKTAHLLDPYDPEIRGEWLQTLPVQERIKAAQDYLNSANGLDPEELKHFRLYLENLKKLTTQPRKPCQLASSETTTELPLARIMRDGTHVRAYGLDVKLNHHNARLEVDTGAGGLLISRLVAKQAGLEQFSATEIGGVGSDGEKSAYTAYVDSIKIGSLEFHNCAVTVLDSRSVVGGDGLIGMNVFSNLLVTLDYPMRKIILGPLPTRPQDVSSARPTLATSAEENSVAEGSGSDTEQSAARPAAAKGPQDRYIAPEMADWTKVYRVGHHLLIPATLNQSVLKLFILDTGAFSTTVSPEAAREVTKVHGNYDMNVRGLSGKVNKVYSTGQMTFDFANLRQPATEVVGFDMSN